MYSIEEIVNFIAEQEQASLNQILSEFDENPHDLKERLRDAEIQGMIMRSVSGETETYTI